MRLIDAEKLVDNLQKWDTPESKSLYNFAMERIIRQPIVYDTDKVIAELESIKRIMESPVTQDCFAEECKAQDCMVCVIDRAIQIVKGGGIDGD